MISDLKFAIRQLAKSPGHTIVVVLTLALGIALNIVIFATVNVMFLQPLAVKDSDRLMVVTERSADFSMPHGLSFLDFQDLRAGSKTLQNVIADFFSPAHVSAPGRKPERGWIEAVTPDAFDRMGVGTILGRPLQPADGELPPGAPVAVITHSFWQGYFGGSPEVIGRPILVNGKTLTIVGVVKPGFESFSASASVNLFVSSGTYAMLRPDGENLFKYRAAKAWRLYAHRAPGVTVADVNAELAVMAAGLVKDYPQEHRDSRLHAVMEMLARPDPTVSEMMPVMIVLFAGLCLLVLGIACANVANLLGARALARERELVVRSALGATRLALMRQLLVESLLLAALAGIAGVILAQFGGELLARSIPTGDMPIRQDQVAGWSLYAFTVGVSLFAGLAAGLMPALRSSRVNLVESLKQGGHQQAGRSRHFLRNSLVIGQVAVSCVVLVCSVLFLRSLQAAGSLNLGFRPERVLMLSLDLGMQGYDEARGLRFMDQALERVRALPGVDSAAFSGHVPFSYNITMRGIWPENPGVSLPDGHTTVAYAAVTPGHGAMMGVPLLRGRDLAESDSAKAPKVAVINEAMAKAFWPGQDPLGKHFRFDWAGGDPVEVVGLVATGKYVQLTEELRPYFYVPQAQRYHMPASLLVRTKTDPAAFVQTLRDVVRDLDADLPVYSVLSLDEHLGTSIFALMPLRTGTKIAAMQGVIALALAVMGLYAIVSSGVTNRTREIGLRMALGASRGDVLRLISREGLRLTVIGVAIGLTLSVLLGLGLSRVLYGVPAFDFIGLGAVIAVLVGIAGLACWFPARRATKVDPMVALRTE